MVIGLVGKKSYYFAGGAFAFGKYKIYIAVVKGFFGSFKKVIFNTVKIYVGKRVVP